VARLGEVVARGSRSSVHAYGRGAVVKVPDASTPADWIRSEAQYTEAVRAVGAPAPRLLGIEEIDGRAASVWERIGGRSMWQHVLDRPARAAELGALLADVQLGLFALVAPVTLPSQHDRLLSKIRWSVANVSEALARAIDVLPPQPLTPRLCHGDLHPANVILGPGGPVLVDWFDASRGDAAADVARSLLTMTGDGADPPRHLPGSDQATLGALTGAYRARVQAQLEIADDVLARWRAINAVARLAEGVPRATLLEIWMQCEATHAAPG
jgi:aminoglycoside phosphotransferase (APT) family kinase protein